MCIDGQDGYQWSLTVQDNEQGRCGFVAGIKRERDRESEREKTPVF